MPRILFVATSSTVGGAEKTLYTLATRMARRNFEVAGVVSLKPKGYYAEKLESEGFKVFSLGLEGAPGPGTIRELRRIVSETRPDVVHAFMYQAIQLCRIVKKLGPAGFKLVSSPRVHYRTRSAPTLWLDRLLKSADDLLVSECEASRRYLVERLGYAPEKAVTIYNGVDSSRGTGFPEKGEVPASGKSVPRAERNELRARLSVRDSDVLIGTAGRLDVQKGHVYLIEAMSRLRVIHPVQCAILGEGPMRGTLERCVRELKLEGCVHLLGEQPDVAAWLGALDIFVLPSVWEGFPNVLLEAMSMGLAVAATRVDGVPELVESEVDGLLCEPEDSQALFEAVQDLIVRPELRKRLGAAAKDKAARFTLPKMLDAYEGAYRAVCGQKIVK